MVAQTDGIIMSIWSVFYECLLMSDNIHGLDLFIWINLLSSII